MPAAVNAAKAVAIAARGPTGVASRVAAIAARCVATGARWRARHVPLARPAMPLPWRRRASSARNVCSAASPRAAVPDASARAAKAARAAAEGRLSQVATALHAAGLIAQASVRNEITSGAFTPLSARTLAERQARGRTGTKPLVDTGQYRNSITYVVRDGKS